MTVSTSQTLAQLYGNSATYSFSFIFPAVAAADIQVSYVSASGVPVTLNPSSYTLTLNPVATGQIWSYGGTVTYPLTGLPISTGTSIIIQRILPLTQQTSISNQTNFYPQVIESALDTLCMEIQQIASRTGLWRGPWVAGTLYNYGDTVVAPAGDSNYPNWFWCANTNTSSSSFDTDLAAGDWIVQFNINALNAVIGAYVPLTGGTISGNLNVYGNTDLSRLIVENNGGMLQKDSSGVAHIIANLNTSNILMIGDTALAGNNIVINQPITLPAGISTAPTATTGTNTTQIATTAFANAAAAAAAAAAIAGDIKVVNWYLATVSGTYTPSAGMKYCLVELWGGGGGASSWGGGGAGGYAFAVYSAATISTSRTYTIGAGGASSSTGSNGGNSAFGGYMIANGGAGGPSSFTGGVGGTASATGGFGVQGGTGTSANTTYPGSVMGGSSSLGSGGPGTIAAGGISGISNGSQGFLRILEFIG